MSGQIGEPGRAAGERPLHAVDPADVTPPPDEGSRHGRGRFWVGALGLALAAALVAYFVELDRSRGLAEQVGQLESELVTARSELEAYESRMTDVRAAVGELSNRIDRLQSLVFRPVEPSSVSPKTPDTP